MPRQKTPDPVAPTPPSTRPRISVIERRLQNPFGVPGEAIQLKEPGWTCRIFNNLSRHDRIWIAKHRLGWEPVGEHDLVDAEQAGGFKFRDGYWCMGERQSEVLLKMLTSDYTRIQRAKCDANVRLMKQPGAAKAEVVEAASGQLGDQAAEFLQQTRIIGSVKDSKEIISYEPQDV